MLVFRLVPVASFLLPSSGGFVTLTTICQVDAATFAQNEVYAVDLVLSTGEGKPREVRVACVLIILARLLSAPP